MILVIFCCVVKLHVQFLCPDFTQVLQFAQRAPNHLRSNVPATFDCVVNEIIECAAWVSCVFFVLVHKACAKRVSMRRELGGAEQVVSC